MIAKLDTMMHIAIDPSLDDAIVATPTADLLTMLTKINELVDEVNRISAVVKP